MPAPKHANMELTTREKDALAAYQKHIDEFHAPPSHRQLASYLGVYVYAAQQLLRRLVDKGFLKEKPVTMRIKVLMPSAKGKKALPPSG